MSSDLATLRQRLVQDVKSAKSSKQRKDSQPGDVELPRPLDWADAFRTISTAAGFASGETPLVAPSAEPFEALELLMRRAHLVLLGKAHPEEAAALRTLLTADYLSTFVSDLYTVWENQTAHAQIKMRVSLDIILALSAPALLDLPDVLAQLRSKLVVDPPDRRRHLHISDVVLKYGQVEDYAAFCKDSAIDTKTGVLRYFLRTITLDEELAQLAGKVVVTWISKCWDAGYTEASTYWTAPLLDTCARSPKELQKVSTYVLPGLFSKRKAAFRELLQACNCLKGDLFAVPAREEELRAALEVVKVGNALNLVESEASTPSQIHKIAFPAELLRACLLQSSPSLRSSALSVLVLSSSPSVPLPAASFSLLSDFFLYSLGEEDAEFRMHLSHLTGRLLLRLRDSSLKAQRTALKGKDGADMAAAYVERVRTWVTWLIDLVTNVNLNPARPFRLKMNSLRILDHALQARIDLRFRVGDLDASITGYSTYRRAATTSISLFQLKHRQVEKRAAHAAAHSSSTESSRASTPASEVQAESGWPFAVDVVNAEVTQMLLRQLLSTYTALRFLVISTLERFPTPLPGYEGPSGAERAKEDLLVPALRMIRSGREAEASAGASIVGLVWRKWVIEGLRDIEEGTGTRWTLGDVGGWSEGTVTRQGPPGFALISSLLDLAEQQLKRYRDDLSSAATSEFMHGTLLALRHLLISIPVGLYDSLSTPEERRKLFHRVLAVIQQVWEVTSPVLAASGPGDEADNDEARALRFERAVTEGAADEGQEASEGSAGPQYKIILNACWRAMKEAGELLETILRIPSEFGTEAFREVWHFDEICSIGDLFGSWLRLARHRGTVANLHPCYTRTAEALMVAGKDWPEVQRLPQVWLESYLEAIVSAGISTTRRSAALPFVILGLMMAILPYDRPAFASALERLFEIAESDSGDIKDESRVHAMNTIRTIYLDSKGGVAAAQSIERGFMLSLKLFWSPNWILRNVAMMLYATLVTRALHPRRVNLDREPESLAKRVSIVDFFTRYPRLHPTLLVELKRGLEDSLDDLPSSNLDSPLFAILMLFGLLQTPESADAEAGPDLLSAPFVPLIKECARSRVWKIRGAAGDALTGLIPQSLVASTATSILEGVETDLTALSANELHGRFVQVLRLLQSSQKLDESACGIVATVYARLGEKLVTSGIDEEKAGLPRLRYPFATLAAYSEIIPYLGQAALGSTIADVASKTFFEAQAWSPASYHLPSAEEYLRACWTIAYLGAKEQIRPTVLLHGLVHRSLEVRRAALLAADAKLLEYTSATARSDLEATLQYILLNEQEVGDVRIGAAELLARVAGRGQSGEHEPIDFAAALRVLRRTANLPLRQAMLPLLATACDADESNQRQVLEILEQGSKMNQSVEEREAASAALAAFSRVSPASTLSADLRTLYYLIAVRLVEDDDYTVREEARAAVGCDLMEGKVIEYILDQAGPTIAELVERDLASEFDADCEMLGNPSTLLFAVEKPNIFRDPLFLPAALSQRRSSTTALDTGTMVAALSKAVTANPALRKGPLGTGGNEVVSRWTATSSLISSP